MSDNNYQEVIKNNKLFDGIPPRDLKFKFINEQIIRKKEGEIIFQKGDESKNTFLIIAGRVKIKIYIENKSVKLNKSINDFFGEIEVLEETYRRSAAVANTDCILYALSKQDLRSFMAVNSEINDNIIAYNKVEIPELKIMVRHDFLKDDTDKLYLAPASEINKDNESLGDTVAAGEENISDNEEKIDELNEEVSEVEDNILNDTTEDKKEEISVSKEGVETAAPAVSTEGESAEKEILTGVITEEEEEENSEEDIPKSDQETNIIDAEAEIENAENQEEKNSREEIAGEEVEVNDLTETTDSVEEFAKDIEDETKSENIISETIMEPTPLGSEAPDNNTTKWINLNPSGSEEEIPDAASDEEKFRYDAAEEKLKYDDTEVSAVRILEAVKKINPVIDRRTVFANIVRESVKLTEAQAGILYRVDSSKNVLITERETEDGIVDVSYSFSGGLTGLAAETGELINVREPLKDFRFSEDVDSILGIAGSSILCVPVKNEDGNTIAVITLVNSSTGKFSISDEERISQLVPHISQTLQLLAGIDKLLDENKNIYLSTLTKFISDNIQTPVLTMKYYAGQIKKKSIPQDIKTVLSVLMDQADSVVDFLHSTLAFTENRNPLRIEKCSLQEVMDDSLRLLAEYVESRNVGLYKKVESNLIVRLDKKAFHQACHQIAKNACDAMGESGNIYITARQSGDLVNIEFRDTGPGIPDQIRDQIFQPFKSFNKENTTGLGLTIAQRIIRDHGGELTVESNPEKGATFIISLPVFDEI